jgi:hypothetical protein
VCATPRAPTDCCFYKGIVLRNTLAYIKKDPAMLI